MFTAFALHLLNLISLNYGPFNFSMVRYLPLRANCFAFFETALSPEARKNAFTLLLYTAADCDRRELNLHNRDKSDPALYLFNRHSITLSAPWRFQTYSSVRLKRRQSLWSISITADTRSIQRPARYVYVYILSSLSSRTAYSNFAH